MSSAPYPQQGPRVEWGTAERAQALVVALAFAAAFYHVLWDLYFKWTHDDNWSHGWIVPGFSAYFVYYNWGRIRGTPVRAAWLGLPVMLLGLGLYQYSLWGLRFGYVKPFSMMICLLGVIILLCGVTTLRRVWLAWAFLFFAVPLPQRTYFELTTPLRQLGAHVAAGLLRLFPSVDVEKNGVVLECAYAGTVHKIGVEDACSGMRSLITLCALGVAMTFMSDRPRWQRVVMVLACVPIAVACNMVRIVATTLVILFVDPRYAEGTYHTALGMGTLALGFALFAALGWTLNNLTVEEPAAAAGAELP